MGFASRPDSRAPGAEIDSPERVALYTRANRERPDAREIERRLLLDRLEVGPRARVLDVIAEGGYLADGIASALDGSGACVCIDRSLTFAETLPPHYCRVVADPSLLPVASASVDRVGCLAGLHHLADKPGLFAEIFRVLEPGGIFAVAEVRADSQPARFLNREVDRYSAVGHKGSFVARGELTRLLDTVGFREIAEDDELYSWWFPDRATAVRYCRTLFRMTRATIEETENAIDRHLEITPAHEGGVGLGWGLLYARGRKP